MHTIPAHNRRVADRLREASALLQVQGASPYRANAYRHAAESIGRMPRDVLDIYTAEGVKGLDAIPHVGLGIASAVAEMLTSGRWAQLDRLRGSIDPATLFRSVPGMGPELARRIHEHLHIDSLEALEAAANDGRLDRVPGIGERRVAAWRAYLAEALGRGGARPPEHELQDEPSVAEFLDVDHEYREKAARGELRTIAPRRFNPEGQSWLPVLHARRGRWHFTALYSNTALAHQLGRTRDWVVIYFYDGDHVERQHTIVTEPRGELAGRRVVRGREDECHGYYQPMLSAA
ncbi:MAG TPA: helix-hairpin-helix domain-containing protein [Usitatibacter sp.]|nr:helix-hairpin-helix domain-containing protein [Usitatibacter sp.]